MWGLLKLWIVLSVTAVIMTIVLSAALTLNGCSNVKSEPFEAEATLVSLKVGGSTPNGSFVIGNGTVRGQTYFISFIRVETGYRYVMFNTNHVTIYEDDPIRPYVKYKMEQTYAKDDKRELYNSGMIKYCAFDIEIHLPKNAEIKEFTIE